MASSTGAPLLAVKWHQRATGSRCTMCGHEVDEHERDIRFTLPDPVLSLPEREHTEGIWMTGSTAQESVMMQVPGSGAFIRALLPVRLTGGYLVRYGVWIDVRPDDFLEAVRVWWTPEYADLRLRGRLANAVEPWGLLAAPVEIAVLDPDQTPWCVESSDDEFSRLLELEWPHQLVLGTPPC